MRGNRGKAIVAGLIAAGVALTTSLAGGSGASAGPATTGYEFVGWAGGSLVRAANNTITSDLTAASSINNEGLVSQTNQAAHVFVKDLLDTGAVNTGTASFAIDGGYELVSHSKLLNINALGGAIHASAVEVTNTVKVVDGVASSSITSNFVNLVVGSIHVPANVPPNFIIRIPNVATVSLNYQLAFSNGGQGYTIGIPIYADLLKARGANAIGASVAIGPTYAALGPVIPPESGHFLYANAYGTKVVAQVGSLAGINSDPTAPITMAAAGTGGTPQTSAIAGVHLDPAASVGAVTDSVNGTNTTTAYDGAAGSRVGAVNLFNGAIKADVIGSASRVFGPASATVPTVQGSSTLVNLVIGGHPIDVNTAPNTKINLFNVAIVTINQQIHPTNRSIIVRALDIVLTTAAYGFPAGAEIQIAVTRASVS